MNEKKFFDWKSQIVMSENDKIGLRRITYFFTIEGIKVLSTIFKSNKARLITKIIIEIIENRNKRIKSYIR